MSASFGRRVVPLCFSPAFERRQYQPHCGQQAALGAGHGWEAGDIVVYQSENKEQLFLSK